ncbi:Radical SAM domain protein [Ignisphaera aggregans DSM 17230]|uniref:Radical SAM domain protein n=1 Tax=Ignisphaera aggregans (strain DSM 17230 / JCM 13409 / AQ1.S1) TaxID=583356 RepID=E0STR7_IGNAA|nr:Radical SAM domain protein [Ignisphaera aggregans DSM 17230]
MKVLREFDPWKSPLCTCPFKYSLHPYTGCSHFCLYCYATSYIGRKPSVPKKNFIENLEKDLRQIVKGAVVELSSSSDPYPPIEMQLELTRKTLEVLGRNGFRILITTKSDIVARDIDILLRYPSAVMITITTLDQGVAKVLEPGAPPPDRRMEAVRKLSRAGIPVGIRIDPVIPMINDDPEKLRELVNIARDVGALQITTSTYKARGDSLKRLQEAFPDIAEKLRRMYVYEGEKIHGYMYLKKEAREKLLKPVIEEALRLGLYIATCREGPGVTIINAPTCDGSGLVSRHRTLNR